MFTNDRCENVPLEKIAREVGTPVYVYSKAELKNRFLRLRAALEESRPSLQTGVYFAVKANSNIHVLHLLQRLGCGADIVSGGELFRALLAEVPPGKVVFSGVGKTASEIDQAIKAGIHGFNAESLPELELLDKTAAAAGARPRVSLRVNPSVDAKTHPHISTGLKKNKFGLDSGELKQAYLRLKNFRNLDFTGLSCHIGSQILKPEPFVKAWKSLIKAAEDAPFEVEELNLGGGLGVAYGREKALSLEAYGRLVGKTFAKAPYRIGLEPGRALVAPAARLLTRLQLVKERRDRVFYVVDAAMNDLIRPALYSAVHECLPVGKAGGKSRKVDLVGPVCETADTFQSQALLPKLKPGSLLTFGNAGAYGMSMASQYNSRPRAAEVLVDGTTYQIIRSRETYADLVQHELL